MPPGKLDRQVRDTSQTQQGFGTRLYQTPDTHEGEQMTFSSAPPDRALPEKLGNRAAPLSGNDPREENNGSAAIISSGLTMRKTSTRTPA
ncbi:MAG: hypothetical protein R3E89_14535 [Thiolinea sp.]